MTLWSRRAERLLPAYHADRLSPRQRRFVAARLAADPALQAASDEVARLAARLAAHDPATPPDTTERARLKAVLRSALAAPPPLARPGLRPAWAATFSLALFAAGGLCGALAFPRHVTREVIREQRVEVPVVKEVIRPVTVEKRVEVPVVREVVKWQTRTVVETRVVYRDRPATVRRTTTGPAAPRPLVVSTARPHTTDIAAVPAGARPQTVDF